MSEKQSLSVAATTGTPPGPAVQNDASSKKAKKLSAAKTKKDTLPIRAILNVHGNNYLDQGNSDQDIISLENLEDFRALCVQIRLYFKNGRLCMGEKMDFCDECYLQQIAILWDGENNVGKERTLLNERNYKEAMRIVKWRKGRDVLLVMYGLDPGGYRLDDEHGMGDLELV